MAKTFNNLKADFLTLSKNSDSNNTTLASTLLNLWIRKILALRDWSFNTTSDTITTVANQQAYELPHNCFRVKQVKQLNSDTYYFPQEITSREAWNALNASSDTSSIPTHWFVNESNQLEVYPKSSVAGNTIYVYFRKTAKDYLETDYETGTVTITNGSVYLIGTGTNWTSTMVGRHFSLGYDGFWYEIGGYLTNAYLTLKKKFKGLSVVASSPYEIGELIPLPEGFEDLVLWASLSDYYTHRGENIPLAQEYERRYKEGLEDLKKRDRRTESSILTTEADIMEGIALNDPNDPPEISE